MACVKVVIAKVWISPLRVVSGAARALKMGVRLAMEGPPGRVGPLPKNENQLFFAHLTFEGPTRA